MKKRSLLLCIITLFAFELAVHAGGISFGPIQAVKKKIDEYEKDKNGKVDAQQASISGVVSGRVLNVRGEPMVNAWILIDGSSSLSGQTDEHGNYFILGIPVGVQHTLKATPGWRDSSVFSREYTFAVQENQAATQDIAFDWIVLGSTISTDSVVIKDGVDYYKMTAANSPYTVTGNMNISNLWIEPGVVIKFPHSSDFTVSNILIASGTASDPIRFTSGRSSPASGDYGGINLGNNCNTSTVRMNYVIFEYGYGQSLYGDEDSVVSNCVFTSSNTVAPGLCSKGVVKNCNFEKNGVLNIYGSPQISYCNINGKVCFCSYVQHRINYCNFTKVPSGAGDYKLEYASDLTIDVTHNWWGAGDESTIASYIHSAIAGMVDHSSFLPNSVTNAGPQ